MNLEEVQKDLEKDENGMYVNAPGYKPFDDTEAFIHYLEVMGRIIEEAKNKTS
jgi:hypothetical protein